MLVGVLPAGGVSQAPRTFAETPGLRGLRSCAVSQAEAILATDFVVLDLLDGTKAYVLAVIVHAPRRVRVLGVMLHPSAGSDPCAWS